MKPYALRNGEGWTYRYGIDHVIKTGERMHGRGDGVFEMTTRAGEEPPEHSHDTEDEAFYVLEGQISFHCDGHTFDLEQGGYVYLPAGLRHGYTIHGKDAVRLLVVTIPQHTPGAWGGYLSDVETQGEKAGSAG